jgi:hypothetical protein
MTRRTKRRQFPFSKPETPRLELADLQADLLESAQRLFEKSGSLDTHIRDTLSDGLARLVYVAFDCEAVNKGSGKIDDDFDAHREWSTEKWFRDRGYAAWYAKGAATLFHTMRMPSYRLIRVVKHRPKKKVAV